MTMAQPGLSVSDPHAYRENLFRLLGERDPLQVLAQTASTLADTVRRHSATVLRTRPFKGKWTANEVIGDLTDSEWVWVTSEVDSVRRQSGHSGHEPGSVGGRPAPQRAREPTELVETFLTMRQLNLALWRRLSQIEAHWRA